MIQMYETKKIPCIFQLFICCQLLLLTANCFSQDIHFSQVGSAPLQMNPSQTGFFNGNVRAVLNYKNQWQIVGFPYRTYAFSTDGIILANKIKNNSYLGIGLFAFSDRAGEVAVNNTQILGSVSGVVLISPTQMISAGIQSGAAMWSISGEMPKWGNQYDGQSYNSSMPGESYPFNSYTQFDISSGLSWQYARDAATLSSNDNFWVNTGIALHHINKAKSKLYFEPERMLRKGLFHLNAHYGIKNTNWGFRPSLMYSQQGKQGEINAGMLIRYMLRESSKITGYIQGAALSVGAQYRVKDAIAPMLMFEFSRYAIGVSYDINLSPLKTATNGRGGVEITLRYVNPNPFGKANTAVRFL